MPAGEPGAEGVVGGERRGAVAARRLGPHQRAAGGLARRVEEEDPAGRGGGLRGALGRGQEGLRLSQGMGAEAGALLPEPGVEGRVQPFEVSEELRTAEQIERLRPPHRPRARHLDRVHPDHPGAQGDRVAGGLQHRRAGLGQRLGQLVQRLAEGAAALRLLPPGPEEGGQPRPGHRRAIGEAQHREQRARLARPGQRRGAGEAPGLHAADQHEAQEAGAGAGGGRGQAARRERRRGPGGAERRRGPSPRHYRAPRAAHTRYARRWLGKFAVGALAGGVRPEPPGRQK